MMFECIDKVYTSVSIDTVTGALCTFSDNIGGLPLKSCTSLISGYQEGSGTPSPDNVRPLHACSSANICNVSDYGSWFIGIYQGIYGFVDLGTLGWNYLNRDNMNIFYADISGKKIQSDVMFTDMYENNGLYSAYTSAYFDKDKIIMATSVNNTRVAIRDDSFSDVTTFTNHVNGNYLIYELETPTTPTITDEQFETLCTAFNIEGQHVLIQFGQTVYCANLDVLTGKLSITHELKTVDENSGIAMSATEGIFYLEDFFYIDDDNESVDCNCYIKGINRRNTAQVANNEDYSFCCQTQTLPNRLMIKDTRFTTLPDYNSWLQSNPVKIAVKLATPIEIPLGGIHLLTQEGVNNIFCDCGDTTVEYIKII